MANAKSIVKAPKSAATKRGRGKSKRILMRQKTSASDSTSLYDSNVVMRRPSNLRTLTSEEKVKLLLQNGQLIKDQLSIKQPRRKAAIDTSKQPKALRRVKPSTAKPLILPDGNISLKTRSKLKLINNILKDELMINDDIKPEETPIVRTEEQQTVQPVNNYYIEIEIEKIDQNKSKSNNKVKKKPVSKTPKAKAKFTNITKKNTEKSSQLKANATAFPKTKQVTLSNGLVLTLALFQCDYCNRMFSNKSSLRRHIYGHLKVNVKKYSLSCKKCSRKFRSKVRLQNHMDTVHPGTSAPYLCNICDKSFTLEENLTLHLANHVKNENAYKCIYCDKKFSYHLLLIQHEKQHLVTGRYQCTICTMSYDCRNRLTMHMKSHLKIKDFICQYCGKEFQRLNSMKRHVEICHGGHRIQCPICKKKLKGHLTEHIRTHKQTKPHECDICGQCFTQSTQLTVHKRSHTGVRPYSCRICKRPFTHHNALMLHIRRHTGEKPFTCAMCPLIFSQLPHMKAHMKNIHGKELPYKCPKCSEFFKIKSAMESHAKTCTVGEQEPSFEETMQANVQRDDEVEVESTMTLSRMRFLLALLFTMITTKEKLKFLGFNKRLIDDLLVESLEAMGQSPCKDESLQPIKRLKTNIQLLLNGTVPKDLMAKFKKEQKTTEELLELLTKEKKNEE